MVLDANTIETSVDTEVNSLAEQIAALQKQAAELKQTQTEEREASIRENIAEVASPFTTQLMNLIDEGGWEALDNAGCIGFEMKRNLVDGVPTLSVSPIRKSAPKAARTATASGTRRNLRGEFEAVASAAQVAYVDSLDATVEKGKRWSYMDRIVKHDDPQSVDIPA